MTNFQRTSSWFAACGKVPGNTEQFSVQLGCDLEEWVEGLACLELALPTKIMAEAGEAISMIAAFADSLKKGHFTARIAEGRREEFLDALCDREVTGNGLAYLSGFDKDGADQSVLNSNDSKLEDGKPVLLPGGKIAKGKHYVAPYLVPFV
jgi:hypothetical protein